MYNVRVKYGFHFVDNSAAFKCDLWKDNIYLLETGEAIIAENLGSIFQRIRIHPSKAFKKHQSIRDNRDNLSPEVTTRQVFR